MIVCAIEIICMWYIRIAKLTQCIMLLIRIVKDLKQMLLTMGRLGLQIITLTTPINPDKKKILVKRKQKSLFKNHCYQHKNQKLHLRSNNNSNNNHLHQLNFLQQMGMSNHQNLKNIWKRDWKTLTTKNVLTIET